MKKKLGFKIIVIIAVVLAAVIVAKDYLLKSAVLMAAGKVTGTKVTMKGFALSILKQSVTITDFKMYNPAGFPAGVMVDIPKIHVSCDVVELFKGKLRIPQAAFTLNEAVVIKNREGKLNVNSLAFNRKKEEKPRAEKPTTEKETKAMPLRIDVLILDIGKVVYADYSRGDKPLIQVYEVGIQQTYKNINSPQELAGLIMSAALKHTAVKGAAVYGVATLAGAAVLPVGVAAVFVGKDSATAEVNADVARALEASKAVILEMGELTAEDTSSGILKARVQGSDVALKVEESADNKATITVSARKMLVPKPQIAGGILHEISARIK